MKVLLINGSCNKNGCTFRALTEIENILKKEKIETEIIQLGSNPIRDCIGCRGCAQNGNKCETQRGGEGQLHSRCCYRFCPDNV